MAGTVHGTAGAGRIEAAGLGADADGLVGIAAEFRAAVVNLTTASRPAAGNRFSFDV